MGASPARSVIIRKPRPAWGLVALYTLTVHLWAFLRQSAQNLVSIPWSLSPIFGYIVGNRSWSHVVGRGRQEFPRRSSKGNLVTALRYTGNLFIRAGHFPTRRRLSWLDENPNIYGSYSCWLASGESGHHLVRPFPFVLRVER